MTSTSTTMPAAVVTRPPTIMLEFIDGPGQWRRSAKKIAESVSAVVQCGRCLWVASDQTASLERLTADDESDPKVYRDHRSFRLRDFVRLPQDDTEVDLEGIELEWLGADTGYLWAIGSHSYARKKADEGKDSRADAIAHLTSVSLDRNRCALLRIPFTTGDDGLPTLVSEAPDPRGQGGTLVAGVLGDLAGALALDDCLGRFTAAGSEGQRAAIPGKDNGLDIEGLAVCGGRLFVGLRGPVLRGWAIVLQLAIEPDPDHSGQLRMQPNSEGELVRKYFLDLRGLGVRDLLADGDDLLVLAGPTMVLDGPVQVYRWAGGATGAGERLIWATELPAVLSPPPPYGVGVDHAEGLTRLTASGTPRLMIAYDAPSAQRQSKGNVRTDLFDWPRG